MLKKYAEKIRFVIVGGLNTLIDFVVLFALVALGLPTIVSNFISTSLALIFSFFANKTFTFRDRNKLTKSQIIYFLIINAVGLWIIQPIIIDGTIFIFKASSIDKYVLLFIGKVIATAVTMIWSYVLYRKFVFAKVKK